MSGPKPVPYDVWIEAVQKWQNACHCSDCDSAYRWWWQSGAILCSFCDFYGRKDTCGECPFRPDNDEATCAPEWDAIQDAMNALVNHMQERECILITKETKELVENTFTIFLKNARAMLAKILALPHTSQEKE